MDPAAGPVDIPDGQQNAATHSDARPLQRCLRPRSKRWSDRRAAIPCSSVKACGQSKRAQCSMSSRSRGNGRRSFRTASNICSTQSCVCFRPTPRGSGGRVGNRHRGRGQSATPSITRWFREDHFDSISPWGSRFTARSMDGTTHDRWAATSVRIPQRGAPPPNRAVAARFVAWASRGLAGEPGKR